MDDWDGLDRINEKIVKMESLDGPTEVSKNAGNLESGGRGSPPYGNTNASCIWIIFVCCPSEFSTQSTILGGRLPVIIHQFY